MGQAEFAQPPQLLLRPQPPRGIVGICHEHDLGPGIGQEGFQAVKVQLIPPVFCLQGIPGDLQTTFLYRIHQGVIIGRLHHHPVPRLRQQLQKHVHRKNHARR